MSLSEDKLMQLMAYADGELRPEEAAQVEAWLAESEEARRVVASFAPLGDFVRTTVAAGQVREPCDVADAVMARIDALPKAEESSVSTGRASVVPLPFWKNARVMAAAGAVAMAAGMFLWLQPRGAMRGESAMISRETARSQSLIPSQDPSQASAAAPAMEARGVTSEEARVAASALAASSDDDDNDDVSVKVHAVEAISNVSLFYTPAVTTEIEGASSVVFWLSDDDSSGEP